MNDTILTAKEVAAELRCSKAQVYKLINGEVAGCPKLPAISIGRKKVVRRASLEAWKDANEHQIAGDIVRIGQELNVVGA